MDNLSQISLGFAEETALNTTPPPVGREDKPVNIGVRIKRLKKVDGADLPQNKDNEQAAVVSRATSFDAPPDTHPSTTPRADPDPVVATAHSLDPLQDAVTKGSGNNVQDGTTSETIDETTSETTGSTKFEAAVFPSETENVSVVEDAASNEPRMKSGRGRKSIRQISEEADLIRIPEDEVLFLKQYYTMGEVAEMFRVNQSLLRFWEAEFDILQPKKNKKGDRYFRPADIKNLHLIYHLLRQRKYTIEGAKDFLRKGKKAEEKFEAIRKLEQIRDFLLEMKASIR